MSLSARRAWIEIAIASAIPGNVLVALRKESVDRNINTASNNIKSHKSLSARRAWIEILPALRLILCLRSLSARRAWIEIIDDFEPSATRRCRSPQGERG